jgi:hypothetical protein
MELPEHMALADLKKAIKAFKTEQTPKLSSKKSVLSEYAVKVGILKSRLGQTPVEAVAAPLQPRSEKKPEPLPEVLKAPKSKSIPLPPSPPSEKASKTKTKKSEPVVEDPAKQKRGSPFASYMASMKGKGYSMSQLAQMYRDQK